MIQVRRCLIFLFISLSFVLASNLGKVKGRVIDENGGPLIGVNIIIERTELGAATDENGEFIVPFVSAGTHQITASYMGYNTVSKEDVIIFSGQTTVLNFRLNPTLITVAPIVVSADRAMVIKTQTQTERVVTAKDIDMLPISDINQIITLQAGVSTSDQGTHIRGGRATEIAYFVDGILTKAPHYGQQSVRINKQAVEEVAITTGGFDAEYGEALSGVINIVTREGTEKLGGLFRYTTDEIFPAEKLNYGYNFYEMSLGGGLLTKSRLRYFVSGEASLTDAFEQAKYKVPSERFDYKMEGKLSYRLPGAKGKVILTGFYSREQYMHYQDIWGDLSFIYHLDHNYGVLRKNYLSTLAFNYMPTKNTIVETKLGYTKYTRFRAVRDLEKEELENRKWYEDYIFNANHFPDIIPTLDEDTLKKNYLVDSMMNYYEQFNRNNAASLRHNPFGATGFFYTVGDQRLWRYEYSRDYQGIFAITSSIGKVHEVKTGANIIYQNVGWYDNNLPYYHIPFWDIYEKDPLKLAAYIQDRMDFEGIIARVGFRLDYFDSKASGLKNPSDFSDSTLVEYPAKWRISPRLGFSMPITERSKLRFNYGHFFQTPTAHDLYRSTEPMVVWLLLHRYNSVLGNADLTVEKTIAYEIGYENQISDIFAFGFIAYYKDIYDLIQTKRVVTQPYPYYQVTNVDYGNVKGIEFTIKKRLYNYWNFDLSYTLQFAKGTASYAWQHYYDIYNDPSGRDPITGEYRLPRVDFWLDFDERHIVNSSFGIQFPEDFGFVPFRDFFTDFIISYHSGFPYTPQNLKGEALGDQNSARLPGYINVDANISKDLSIMGLKFSLFSQVYNLFNTEQIISVYSSTGQPDDDGGEAGITLGDFGNISMTSSYYTPQADYNHDGLNSPDELMEEYIKARRVYYSNPFHWKQGFRVRIGFGLKF
jgi:outer membrane cobalamin receptor